MKTRSLTLVGLSVVALIFIVVTGGFFFTTPNAPGPIAVLGEHLTRSRPVSHIELLKLKETTQASQIKMIADGMTELQTKCIHPILQKPYILNIRGGANTSPGTHENGITHVFVLDFSSPEHLEYYLKHDPVHKEYQEKIAPLLELQNVQIDFQHGKYTSGWWDI